ncbi:antitoxin Xre-like helix-turn-helix domain-containing protein [Desulfoluna sp.]|uniref:type II RES/Xre toxin-antitoxin system antitoxin n=1 Tax=Desulfoluna sp. TaxID=2045199 RepID=UPI002606AB05|nr:antitoxin Xre-like helix-turn-helix domain-containing protein [Desulfoluna sp.]
MLTDERPRYGCHLLGVDAVDLDAVITALEAGLPYRAFESLWNAVGISQKKLAEAVRINPRILARRKQEERFHADESERLFRIAMVVERAIELMQGNAGTAAAWLMKPAHALKGKRPLDYVDTELGAQAVMRLMERFEHGAFGGEPVDAWVHRDP